MQIMAMENFSRHQQGIIKRYYSNQETIQLQKVGELVSELYLAEGKKREKMWKTVATALEKLDVPKDRIAYVVQQDKPELLAKLVQELMGK
jgi:transcriptional regulator NrdR family protein